MAVKRNFWILADTHFGHDMLVKENLRPEGFEEKIISNLARQIKWDDIVIHLGDISFYQEHYWHSRFKAATDGCKRWLARGNHDKKTNGWYLEQGWDFVAESFFLEIYGLRIAFSHKPITAHDDFDLNIHGHLHDNCHRNMVGLTNKHKLVYMEHEYAPINLRALVGM